MARPAIIIDQSAIDKIASAAYLARSAHDAARQADRRLRAAIRAAVESGEPRTVIAAAAGISRGRLYQIIDSIDKA